MIDWPACFFVSSPCVATMEFARSAAQSALGDSTVTSMTFVFSTTGRRPVSYWNFRDRGFAPAIEKANSINDRPVVVDFTVGPDAQGGWRCQITVDV